MGYPPPSPPAKSAGFPPTHPARPPRSTVDSHHKQQLLAKLKASTTVKTSEQHCFKVPALPTSRPVPILAPPSGTNVTAAAVRVVPLPEARSAIPVTDPLPKEGTTQRSLSSATPPAQCAPQLPAKPSPNPSTPTVKVPQMTEDEAIVRDFGYRTPEEIDLHKRVNKHVNGYLKKTCGIRGGVKAYTQKEAWKILSQMEPLDLSTYPEVFEPEDTDQVAKYLNRRRQMLEEFQKSPMPMPPLPLLPDPTPFGTNEAAKKERARQSLEWGIQGVANRGRMVISKSDLQAIKAEVASLRKATAQVASAKISTVSFSLAAIEKEEPLLSRSSTKKAPHFTYHPPVESDSRTTNPTEVRGVRALKNSCGSFADVRQRFGSSAAHFDEEENDESCPLFKPVKLEEICDLGMKLTPQDADTIKQEIRKLSALRGTTADQRLKQCLLKPFWSASVDEASKQSGNLLQLSPPIRRLKGDVFEDRKTSHHATSGDESLALLHDFSEVKALVGPGYPSADQDKVEARGLRDVHTPPPRNLLEMVDPISSGDRASRYFTCLDSTPTLALSSASDADRTQSSSPHSSPTCTSRPVARTQQIFCHEDLPDTAERETLEVPMASRIQLCGEDRTLRPSDFAASLPKFPLSDLSSSPSGPAMPRPQWNAEQKATTSTKTREQAVDVEFAKYPESIFSPPTFDAASGYLPIPRLPIQATTAQSKCTLQLPKTLKEMAKQRSAGSDNVTGAMERYEGMQSLVYSLNWNVIAKEGSVPTVENILSSPITGLDLKNEQVQLTRWSTTRFCTKVPDAELEEPDIAIQPRAKIMPAKSKAASTTEGFADSDSFQPPEQTVVIQQPDDLPVAKRRKAKPSSARLELSMDSCPVIATTGAAPSPSITGPLESETDIGIDPEYGETLRQAPRPMTDITGEAEVIIARYVPVTSPSSRVLSNVSSRNNPSAPLTRYLSTRHNLPDVCGDGHQKDLNGERFTNQQTASIPTSLPLQIRGSHLQTEEAIGVQVCGAPGNPPEIEEAVDSIIESSKSLENIPLMINNEIYNKRPVISALDQFHIQLYGHDSLEVDFLLDPRTGCLHLPLASLPATMDQLIQKAIMLAHRFEHLIFVFALYPAESRRTERAILPNPWSKAVQNAFNIFKGRVKRQIIIEHSHTYQGSFTHKVDVYLSDNSVTLAALLRLHLEQSRMPPGPLDLSEWITAFGEDSNDWLDVGLKRETLEIREGLELSTAPALYIEEVYGTTEFLEDLKNDDEQKELAEVLGYWKLQKIRDTVLKRGNDMREMQDSSEQCTLAYEYGSPSLPDAESIRELGGHYQSTTRLRQERPTESPGTDFENGITADEHDTGREHLRGNRTLYSGDAYISPPGMLFATEFEDEDELHQNLPPYNTHGYYD